MKRELISQALSDIDDKYISESAKYRPAKSGGNAKIVRRIVVLAAVVALLMALGATAYAKGWLGLSPLVVNTQMPLSENSGEHDIITLSQPQAVPEDLPEVNELAEKSKQAWQEFQDRKNQLPEDEEYDRLYDLIINPTLTKYDSTYIENGDGTVTINYCCLPDDFDWKDAIGLDEPPLEVLESRVVSEEDYQRFWELYNQHTNYECEYDFNYWLESDDEKALLEDVAAKYGLNLRKSSTVVWSSETTGQSGSSYYTNAELTDMTNSFCKGNIFYSTPDGFDKLYWYDEGTFGVSFYLPTDTPDRLIGYYGYNSVYTTLSTGTEVISGSTMDTYQSRTHVCPDGTEVEVLYDDTDAYFYVYLDDSFFAGHISVTSHNFDVDFTLDRTLSAEEIDNALDSINYSLI
jgi:hypothetical protein